ncbi:MAG TPA: Rnase Y domain-containing protein, partial [Kofleriaceae bacterium]|nr:Rnase Y domain-containing protein [Kofleriaceae bacterium]
MILAVVAGLVALAVAGALAARAARGEATRSARRAVADAKAEAAARVRAAQLEAAAERRRVETAARTEVLEARAAADDELAAVEARAQAREDAIETAHAALARDHDALDARDDQLGGIQRDVQARRDRAHGLEQDAQRKHAAARAELEQRAGVAAAELIAQLGTAWIDDARAKAAAAVRAIEQTAADPAHDREARRVMEIAAARSSMHFLTERATSNLRIGPELVAVLLDDGAALHGALERVAGVQLHVNDDKDAVRLEGLDGVGREVVRRALHRLAKKPETIDDARRAPDEWAHKAREHLGQEIRALGKKAFQVLHIQKAHPEIVELVGALNFRTSYTQNQWLHAVEASFLAGMMAAELGLDEKLARRATLMHDIGKALTHKIEGSHAVIGADIARRLGEPELIANAIGA